jgi:phosphate starvation-inducible PhoH-like protein
MMMFLTRMGNGSKIIVTGDTSQIDLPPNVESGLIDALERLEGLDGIAVVYLDERDIVRHPLVQRVLSAYGQRRPSVPGTAYPPRA